MEMNSIHKSAGTAEVDKKQLADKNQPDYNGIWCTKYTNRWGQVMMASKYGYKAWHFLFKK